MPIANWHQVERWRSLPFETWLNIRLDADSHSTQIRRRFTLDAYNYEEDLLKNKLPPTLPNKLTTGKPARKRKDYTPVGWHQYFKGKEDVKVGENTFRVYTAGDDGAVLLLLHGGGHSSLSWAVFTDAMTKSCNCRILAIDLRGHGHSKTQDDANLAADVLAKDVGDVVMEYFKSNPPPIVMLGHSMGGAIAVHVAVAKLLPTLVGLVVIDVVEGTALRALSAMDGFLKSRPQAFSSLEQSIEWSIRCNQVRNLESAKVSIPGQLYRTSKVKMDEIWKASSSAESAQASTSSVSETIAEEQLGDEIVINKDSQDHSQAKEDQASKNDSVYTWRIDLTKTEIYWQGWFENMSALFLSCDVPKLLVLAGIDRLDRDLTIGQMQGKFQMHVIPNCGHTVHEDAPKEVAEMMLYFLLRNKIASPKNVPFQSKDIQIGSKFAELITL
eukprot:gene6966-7751_t